jgi:uncharacterized protein YaiL (DUF2058 family)
MKAGLIDAKQGNGISRDKRKQERQLRKQGIEVVDEAKLQVQLTQQQKAEHDRELNRQLNEQAQQKAIIAQIKQLITVSRIPRGSTHTQAELSYNFTDGTKIKKILVTETILDKLSNGRLAIVKMDGNYEVVPKSVADKIRQRDENYVVVSNTLQANNEQDDDPYAEYKIPDDLMW